MAGAAPLQWHLPEAARLIPGFAAGSAYPGLQLALCGPALRPAARRSVERQLLRLLGQAGFQPAPDPAGKEGWERTVRWLLGTLHRIVVATGLPVEEVPRILALQQPLARCHFPGFGRSLEPLLPLLKALLDLLGPWSSGAADARLEGGFATAFNRLAATGFSSTNVPNFLRAAHRLGLPVAQLPGGFFQYGEGIRSCWLDSTYTGETPHIASRLAGNKRLAGAMLRRAGLPVPEQRPAGTLEQALAGARALGWPVVIKPANTDGGLAVFADLRSEAEVRAAWEAARKHSEHLLVERHVPGRDYRLTVFRDQVVWAVERIPPGVTGDGRSTIRQLVDLANADPLRAMGPRPALKPLVLDAGVLARLARNGLGPDSIPPEGCFVRFSGAANVAVGGIPVAVFDQVHPDNARLAVRAAEAFRLDIAGIDLLIPDIARSWQESGAAICEVNAQPQLGITTSAHLYPQLLGALVPGDGRLASAILAGLPAGDDLAARIAAGLAGAGLCVGWHGAAGVFLGGERLAPAGTGPLAAGQMITQDRRAQVLLLSAPGMADIAHGLPVPRVDHLLLGGACSAELAGALAPACDGTVYALADAAADLLPATCPVTRATACETMCEALRAADRRHGAAGQEKS